MNVLFQLWREHTNDKFLLGISTMETECVVIMFTRTGCRSNHQHSVSNQVYEQRKRKT